MAAPRLRLVKSSTVVQPHTRTSTTWTPSRIRAVEASADSGDMRLVGELCEWLLGDELIARLLHQRAQALLALTPTFEQSGDKRRSGRVVKALEAGEDYWDGWPETTLTQLLVWGILAGFQPARHAWEVVPGHGGRVLPLPQIWDVAHTRYDFHRRTWLARVVNAESPLSAGIEEAFTPGDGTWILHAPHGLDKPWRRGLWRGLARFRLLRDHGTTDLGKAGEGATRNVIEADKDREQTKEEREELANDLLELGRDGTIVLSPGLKYKLVEMAAGSVTIFDKQFEISERAITIAIRGGNLSTNVSKNGARAAVEAQIDVNDQANLAFDAQSLTTTLHDQSMVWWAEYNFGNRELAPWPVYPVEPEEDLALKTESEEKAFAVVESAERLGFEVDREAFLEAHKITWAKPGKKPEPPAPTGQPGAPPAPGQQPPAGPEPEPEPKDGPPRALAGAPIVQPSAAKRGALNGQIHADKIVDEATAAGVKALAPTRAAVLEELEAATSYDDLRERLHRRYEHLSPDALAELVYAAMVMGELTGRAAVREDL